MTAQPSPHALILEIERALGQSQDPSVQRLGHSLEVGDFLDTQRMKMEQGRWSPMGYRMDRIKLQACKTWRQSPEQARAQVGDCLVNLGGRIQMANEMKSFLSQVNEVGGLIAGQLPQGIRDFANKITQRRETETTQETPTPGRHTP